MHALVNRLKSQGADVLVHLDRKVNKSLSDITMPGAPSFDTLPLIAKRKDVNWGGFGMIRATLALLDAASDAYDYYYLCSGQDYPVRSVDWLKGRLAALGGDFIEAAPMPRDDKPMKWIAWRWNGRISHEHWEFKCKTERFLNIVKPPPFEMTFGMKAYAGSQWWCLSRETIRAIMAYRETTPLYDRYMRWTHCPDETYFQTLAARFSKQIHPKMTAVYGLYNRMHPEDIGEHHFPDLSMKPYFMARKWSKSSLAYREIIHSGIPDLISSTQIEGDLLARRG